jgi:hypothetical protein
MHLGECHAAIGTTRPATRRAYTESLVVGGWPNDHDILYHGRMSDLFPDAPEFRHIPEAGVTLKEATVCACLVSAMVWPCPKLEHHLDHGPHHEQAEILHPQRDGVLTSGSSADVPMPFNQFDWPVPQRRSSNAHMMMSSTNMTLLFGDTPTTTQDSTGIFRADNG